MFSYFVLPLYRSLDLECEDEAQAYEWFTEMSAYLAELKEAYERERDEAEALLTDKLSKTQKALEAEREAKAKEIANMESQKNETLAELDAVNSRRAELLAKMESQKSQMDEMKIVMAEERDQLISRVNDLRKQVEELTTSYEAELARNSVLLSELQEERQKRTELLEVREKLAKLRTERAQQAQEVSAALKLFSTKFGLLHGTIEEAEQADKDAG